jgi:hypothetical protein
VTLLLLQCVTTAADDDGAYSAAYCSGVACVYTCVVYTTLLCSVDRAVVGYRVACARRCCGDHRMLLVRLLLLK